MIHENTLIPTVWTLYLLRCVHLLSLALRLSHWEAELWLLEYLDLGNEKLFQHHHFRKEKRQEIRQQAGHSPDMMLTHVQPNTPYGHRRPTGGSVTHSDPCSQPWAPSDVVPCSLKTPKTKEEMREVRAEKVGYLFQNHCLRKSDFLQLPSSVYILQSLLYEDTYELATLKSE